MTKRRDRKVQYAALPYRQGPQGLEVLLITSRGTGRWVAPKGWPMKDRAPHEAAAQEALEEAGVEGEVSPEPLGGFGYLKRLKSGRDRPVQVTVFPLKVTAEHAHWKEAHERTRRWFAPAEAASLVNEAELRRLIAAFGERGA